MTQILKLLRRKPQRPNIGPHPISPLPTLLHRRLDLRIAPVDPVFANPRCRPLCPRSRRSARCRDLVRPNRDQGHLVGFAVRQRISLRPQLCRNLHAANPAKPLRRSRPHHDRIGNRLPPQCLHLLLKHSFPPMLQLPDQRPDLSDRPIHDRRNLLYRLPLLRQIIYDPAERAFRRNNLDSEVERAVQLPTERPPAISAPAQPGRLRETGY
jgi:hypothetical protein